MTGRIIFLFVLLVIAFSVSGNAYEVNFDRQQGSLIWTNDAGAGARYAVRWVNTLYNNWRSEVPWTDIVATGNVVTAAVPLFYSVLRVPEDGLIAWYRFVYDTHDYSTNGLDGVALPGVVLGPGQTADEAAMYFPGGSNYISCGTSPLFNLSNSVSVCCWLNMRTTNQCYLLSNTDVDSAGQPGIGFSYSYHAGVALHFNNTTAGQTGSQLPTNQWIHLAATYDNPQLSIYVDGVLVTNKSNYRAPAYSSLPMVIGAKNEDPDWALEGSLKNVRLYDRALTSNEVQAIYQYELR